MGSFVHFLVHRLHRFSQIFLNHELTLINTNFYHGRHGMTPKEIAATCGCYSVQNQVDCSPDESGCASPRFRTDRPYGRGDSMCCIHFRATLLVAGVISEWKIGFIGLSFLVPLYLVFKTAGFPLRSRASAGQVKPALH